ncbi:MAG: hypothetical protein U1C73_12525, partial [Dietzia sp.]|nr:hypothetical protein [Dietzia sp.]
MATATLTAPGGRTDRRRPQRTAGQRTGNFFIYFLAWSLVVLILVPVAYIIIGGFRTNSEITQDPAGLPATWQFENYLNVLTSDVFWREVLNSSIA